MLAPAVTRQSALRWAWGRIDKLDARLLLMSATDCTQVALLADPDAALNAEQWATFQTLVAQRADGVPVAYLTGEAGFYGDLLEVSPAVLVPRPETEDLVRLALSLMQGRVAPHVVDLGTGNGAIALALAGALPQAQILAIDVSPDAIAVATRNRDRLGRRNVTLRVGDWLKGCPADASFDLIVSNPPYIAATDPHLSGDGVRFEPRLALIDEGDGLASYRAIAAQAVPRLNASGYLLVEHGHDQAEAVAALWRQSGLIDVASQRDLSGNPRLTVGRKPERANG